MATTGRSYGGRTEQERREARRAQLIETGLELFGTQGFHATSIRAVLRHSGLAERYFRESFGSMEELLIAVYDHVLDDVFAQSMTAVLEAGADRRTQARAGLRAFIETVTSDPRYARIQLYEVFSASGMLLAHGQAVLRRFAELIASRDEAGDQPDPLDPGLIGLGLTGAVHVLLFDWVEHEMTTPSLDRLLDHMMLFFEAALDRTPDTRREL